MAEFQTVTRTSEIVTGEGRTFAVSGQLVAVFLVDGEYFAINDLCPHMGASLSGGYLENGVVACPWHAWRFCVKDGTWVDNPNSKLRTDSYEVRLVGDEIQVLIPDPEPPITPEADACDGDACDGDACDGGSCNTDSSDGDSAGTASQDQPDG